VPPQNTHLMYRLYVGMNFGMPENISFKMIYKTIEVNFQFKRKKFVSHNPYEGDGKDWKVHTGTVMSVSVPKSDGSNEVFQEFYVEDGNVFKHGYKIHGVNNFVDIIFPRVSIKSEENRNFAFACFTRFREIYQVTTGFGHRESSHHVSLPITEIYEGVQNKDTSFTFYKSSPEFAYPLPDLEAFEDFQLTREQIDKVANRIAIDKDLEIYQKLVCDAQRQYAKNKDYPLSIVIIGTAFEAHVQKSLSELCKSKNIKKLKARGKNIPVHEAISKGNIGILIKEYLNQLCTSQPKVEATNEYKNWYRDAYLARNKIIHRGERNFSEDDAKKAFTAANDLMILINKLVAKSV